ncbi:TraR/DksA family transcriptional regulator [Salaquimonas pukyongi]|uniref:TraR/DksA family transcriptional regulator n=1 Tax=Salaquimonas pukyongi TaxID=2712698 RepID=UPI00096B74DB|nr:TraR/DksA C4-type zinc finger protein [Salaquimonas pukyongi]
MPQSEVAPEKFKEILERRLAYLENRLESIEDSLDDPKSRDWEEHAVETEGDEVMEELGLSGLEEIKAIKAALDRVEAGTFGECAKCGKEISSERLEAVPHTPFCRSCARA